MNERYDRMELNPKLAHYIVRFHNHLMTDTERRAQSHLFATMKATMGRSDAGRRLGRRDGAGALSSSF